jgi:hypothetical protein
MHTKITNKQALTLYQALNRLDAGDAPGSSNGQAGKARSAFSFKGKATYAFARNLKRLKAIVEDLEKARVETFKRHRQGEEESLTGAAAAAFTIEFQEVLDTVNEVEILQIDVADLDLDRNPVAADVLAELLDTVVTGELK